jgi:hypothetical protein
MPGAAKPRKMFPLVLTVGLVGLDCAIALAAIVNRKRKAAHIGRDENFFWIDCPAKINAMSFSVQGSKTKLLQRGTSADAFAQPAESGAIIALLQSWLRF